MQNHAKSFFRNYEKMKIMQNHAKSFFRNYEKNENHANFKKF